MSTPHWWGRFYLNCIPFLWQTLLLLLLFQTSNLTFFIVQLWDNGSLMPSNYFNLVVSFDSFPLLIVWNPLHDEELVFYHAALAFCCIRNHLFTYDNSILDLNHVFNFVFNFCIWSHLYFKVFDADFQKGFEYWCEYYGKTFSSKEERRDMFKWLCDNYRCYGCHFYCGSFPHKELVDHIRKYENVNLKMANEFLLEKLRCANLLLMQCRGCT
jgi:hypothetical protein